MHLQKPLSVLRLFVLSNTQNKSYLSLESEAHKLHVECYRLVTALDKNVKLT